MLDERGSRCESSGRLNGKIVGAVRIIGDGCRGTWLAQERERKRIEDKL